MNKKPYIIGIDFGGTFVKLGKLTGNGIILSKSFFATSDFISRDGLISEILRHTRSLIGKDKAKVSGVGIGMPGQIDYRRGIIHNLTNVKGWKEVPLREILRKELNLPVYLDNDANVACIGEAVWGAAKGYNNIVCITLGTGVGGGLIINGEVYRGINFSAAETGHICIDKNGPLCNCGSYGCMEAFVGNHYIVRDVVRRLKRGERSILLKLAKGKFSNITPKLIDQAAKKGDGFSIRVWKEVGENIGIGLASVINLLNPDIIVIGGGISKTGKILLDAVRDSAKKRALAVSLKGLKIIRAKFVDDAGVVGAAALVKMERGRVPKGQV